MARYESPTRSSTSSTTASQLQLIRQTYETDLHIDGTAIALGIWSDKNNAIELAYGKGNGILSGLERIKHDDTPTPMSLYVTGTKRNMTKGRLTMQQLETLKGDDLGTIYHGSNPDIAGRLYGTDKTGQYISEFTHDNGTQPLYTEATYTNEEIYPSHVSMIKVVTKVKDHFEVNSDFDYSKLLIDGEQMQVVFQTGNLAGRDFDARHYASSGRLAIVPKEEDDTTLPNDTLCPKVGDQYIVTGIKLPDKYIKEAQRRLTEEALHHLVKLQQQRYSYKAEIDPVYLHNNKTTIGNKLDVGQYVHLTDQQIAIGDPYIRIVGKRTYLDRPYTPEIELSNEVERLSLFDRLIRDTSGVLADREVILGRLTASSVALDSLVATSTDLSERLPTAEGSVQSLGKTLSGQAQALDLVAGSVERLSEQYSIEAHTIGSPILKSDTDRYTIQCRITHIPTGTDYTDLLLHSAQLITPEWYRINPEKHDRTGYTDIEWRDKHRGDAEVTITRKDFLTSCTVGYKIPREQIVDAIKTLEH